LLETNIWTITVLYFDGSNVSVSVNDYINKTEVI